MGVKVAESVCNGHDDDGCLWLPDLALFLLQPHHNIRAQIAQIKKENKCFINAAGFCNISD